MLVLVHGHGTQLEQAGNHVFAALRTFAPHRAGHQEGVRRRVGKGGVAE
jgi:hypothetical protein